MRIRRALAVVAALAAAAVLAAPARASQEEVFEKAFSMEGVTKVSLENVNGQINAQAWDKPYVKVRAVKSASSAEALNETEIRVRKVGDEIKIETITPRRRRLFGFLDLGTRNVKVDYELWVPTAAATRLETCNGRVEGSGFSSDLSIDSVNGSIDLREVAGPVKATTVNGSVRVAFKGLLKKAHLETVNGSVEIAFDKSSSVRYDLETINGRIETDLDFKVEGKFGPKEAKGSFNGGAETLHCETVNGSIRLKTSA
ncbi:MAG TPA: DUF4097 family beta strand repeat-containing protein [Thermoanaerobaculia bacterium]|jgi:DUF4097 and DUF4098 domain-containing protein YvlB